jgi:hypothetical protein
MLQFVIGGLQGELGFTSLLNNNDLNFEASSALDNSGCMDTFIPDPEVHLSTPFSVRNFLRMSAPPEFGDTLLALLTSSDPASPRPAGSHAGQVQLGAMLFGVDLTAFANRMIPGRMPETGDDGLDPPPEDVICPPYDSPLSQTHRGEAREVILRVSGAEPCGPTGIDRIPEGALRPRRGEVVGKRGAVTSTRPLVHTD